MENANFYANFLIFFSTATENNQVKTQNQINLFLAASAVKSDKKSVQKCPNFLVLRLFDEKSKE